MQRNVTKLILPQMGLGCLELTRSNNGIVDYAIKNNITYFDTADCYGNGESERALGEKLILNKYREKLFISTKGGVKLSSTGVSVDGTSQYLKQACDASLNRLQIDYVDLYYLHRTDPDTPIEESVKALSELVQQGKVNYIGLSEVTADQIRRAHHVHPITAVQIEYSPWSTQDDKNGVIETCRELGIQIVSYSPLGRAFFTDVHEPYFENIDKNDFRRLLPRYWGEHYKFNRVAKHELDKFASVKQCSVAQLVLAWELKKGFSVIPATTKENHFDEDFKAIFIELSDNDINSLNNIVSKSHYSGPRYPNESVSAIFPEKSKSKWNNSHVLFGDSAIEEEPLRLNGVNIELKK